jgi:hypothetical protein
VDARRSNHSLHRYAVNIRGIRLKGKGEVATQGRRCLVKLIASTLVSKGMDTLKEHQQQWGCFTAKGESLIALVA